MSQLDNIEIYNNIILHSNESTSRLRLLVDDLKKSKKVSIENIYYLKDYKGFLTVLWQGKFPHLSIRIAFSKYWGARFCELSANVSHKIINNLDNSEEELKGN